MRTTTLEARIESAMARLARLEWAEAARDLERAAAEFPDDGARLLGLAATVRRFEGETGAARHLAERASLADPASAGLRANRMEAAFADGDDAETVRLADEALKDAGPELRAAVLRRRGEASIRLGRLDEGARDYEAAARAMGLAYGPALEVEHAGILLREGHPDAAEAVLAGVRTEDSHAAAEAGVLRARLLRAKGRFADAAAEAAQARIDAREAVAPTSYFAASVEGAESARAVGDRAEAYRSLATAWATLGDLLGRDVARSWVAPVLEAYRLAWGDEGFARVKAGHDAARREARR